MRLGECGFEFREDDDDVGFEIFQRRELDHNAGAGNTSDDDDCCDGKVVHDAGDDDGYNGDEDLGEGDVGDVNDNDLENDARHHFQRDADSHHEVVNEFADI